MTDSPTSRVTEPLSARISGAELDLGLRRFMLTVYNYMASGLALTGVVAYVAAESGLYAWLVKSPPLFWAIMLAPLVIVFILSFRIQNMSVAAAQAAFWAYAGLIGLSLSGVLLVYTGASIARAFFIAAATFLAMSLYGYTTRADLARVGSFLLMGLIGLVIASLVNMFLASSALQLAISVVGVFVFVGLTAYDTQRLKEIYLESDTAVIASKKAIIGALTLYLDLINLFLLLLQLSGERRE
jgi:FtsH-binding integral membrane protein